MITTFTMCVTVNLFFAIVNAKKYPTISAFNMAIAIIVVIAEMKRL